MALIALSGVQCVQDFVVAPPSTTYEFNLTPDSALVHIGDTVTPFSGRLTADGREVDFTVRFTVVEGANVVRVDSLGRLIAIGRGLARIRARPMSVALPVDTISATVTAWAAVPRIGLSTVRTEDTLTSLQETITLQATAQTQSGVAIPGVPIAWRQVSGGAVAVLEDSAAGRVRAVANGVAEFEASVDGVSARRPVRVRQVATSLTATDSVRLRSFGQTAQLTATARDARGNGIADAAPVWTTLDPAVATVNTAGQVRSVANGVARIEARVGTTADTTRVTVAQAAYQLAFTVQPAAITAGTTLSPAIVVGVRDSLGTVVAAATNSVVMALSGGGTMSGNTTRSAVGGVATFDDLRVLTAGSGKSLIATASGLVGATSNAFTVTAAAPALLTYGTQPGAVRVGTAIGPPVDVRVADGFGNLVTTASVSVTITLGTNPGGGTLSGTTTQAGAGGIATFPDLTIDRAGAGYTLVAAATGLTSVASAPFTVELPPARLAFKTQPSTTVAGVAVAPAVQVETQDSLGNPVTLMTASVDLALGPGAPGGAALTGTVSAAAVGGVAAFGNLRLRTTGSGYTLVATSAGLAGAASGAFNVVPGPANRLGFVRQPSTAEVNAVLVPPVDVAAIDSTGNVVTGAAASVSLTLATYPAGATLAGTTTVSTTGGIATFSDLRLSLAGTGYTLRATATGLTSAVSTGITVSACTDQYEPNETFAAATSLGADTTVTAKVCTTTDSDFFKFTVSAGQGIRVVLAAPPGLDYHVTIYSPVQATLSDLHTGGVTDSVSVTASTAGTYYAKVYGFGASSATATYALTVRLQDQLTVTPASVALSATEGATAAQTADLTLTGTAPLAWTATRTRSSAWLALDAASGTTPSTVRLTLDPTGLAPGIYGDTVVVTAAGATGSPDSTPVAFTIACTDQYEPNDGYLTAKALTLGTPVSAKLCRYNDSDYFSFSVVAGQRITIALSPPSSYYYTAELYFDPSQTALMYLGTTGSPAQSTYTAQSTGTYYVRVVPASATVSTTLLYTLTVTLQDVLTVTPASVTKAATEGATATQTADLTLTGTAPLAWTSARTRSSAWLALDAASGTTPSTVRLTLDPTGLAPGIYRDTVVVTAAGATGSPDSTPVTFTITCSDAFEPNEDFGTAAPLTPGTPVTAKVCNSGDGDYFSFPVVTGQVITVALTPPPGLMYQATLYSSVQTQLATLFTSGGSATSTTYVAPTSGTYFVKVNGFGVSSALATYTLTVTLQDQLTVTPGSVTQSVPEGSTTSVTADLTLSGTNPLAWSATRTRSSAWLALNAASGTTPSTLQLTLNSTGLVPGIYRDTVVVTAAGAAGSPDSTPVAFTITCSDAYEPNDAFGTASPLTSGTPVTGKLCSTFDSDYFSFPVVTGQSITVALSPPSAYVYRAYLYTPAQNLVTWIVANGVPAQGTFTAAFTGTYYVIVEVQGAGSVSTTTPYTLTVTVGP